MQLEMEFTRQVDLKRCKPVIKQEMLGKKSLCRSYNSAMFSPHHLTPAGQRIHAEYGLVANNKLGGGGALFIHHTSSS